jgi:WD40 repeat protein
MRLLPRVSFSLRTLLIAVLALGSIPLFQGGFDSWVVLWTADCDTVPQYSADGTKIFFSRWNEVNIRNAHGEERKVIDVTVPGDENLIVRKVVYDPTCQKIASLHHDGILRVWDVSSGKLCREFGTPEDRILSASISDDGTRLVTRNDAQQVLIVDLQTLEEIKRIATNRLPVIEDVAFVQGTNKPQLLHKSGQTTTIESDFSRVTHGRPLYGYAERVGFENIFATNMSFNRKRTIYGRFDGTIEIRDAAGHPIALLQQDQSHHNFLKSLSLSDKDLVVSPIDDQLVVRTSASTIAVWQRRRPEPWSGIVWLPAFWIAVSIAVLLVWSGYRDFREHQRRSTSP